MKNSLFLAISLFAAGGLYAKETPTYPKAYSVEAVIEAVENEDYTNLRQLLEARNQYLLPEDIQYVDIDDLIERLQASPEARQKYINELENPSEAYTIDDVVQGIESEDYTALRAWLEFSNEVSEPEDVVDIDALIERLQQSPEARQEYIEELTGVSKIYTIEDVIEGIKQEDYTALREWLEFSNQLAESGNIVDIDALIVRLQASPEARQEYIEELTGVSTESHVFENIVQGIENENYTPLREWLEFSNKFARPEDVVDIDALIERLQQSPEARQEYIKEFTGVSKIYTIEDVIEGIKQEDYTALRKWIKILNEVSEPADIVDIDALIEQLQQSPEARQEYIKTLTGTSTAYTTHDIVRGIENEDYTPLKAMLEAMNEFAEPEDIIDIDALITELQQNPQARQEYIDKLKDTTTDKSAFVYIIEAISGIENENYTPLREWLELKNQDATSEDVVDIDALIIRLQQIPEARQEYIDKLIGQLNEPQSN